MLEGQERNRGTLAAGKLNLLLHNLSVGAAGRRRRDRRAAVYWTTPAACWPTTG